MFISISPSDTLYLNRTPQKRNYLLSFSYFPDKNPGKRGGVLILTSGTHATRNPPSQCFLLPPSPLCVCPHFAGWPLRIHRNMLGSCAPSCVLKAIDTYTAFNYYSSQKKKEGTTKEENTHTAASGKTPSHHHKNAPYTYTITYILLLQYTLPSFCPQRNTPKSPFHSFIINQQNKQTHVLVSSKHHTRTEVTIPEILVKLPQQQIQAPLARPRARAPGPPSKSSNMSTGECNNSQYFALRQSATPRAPGDKRSLLLVLVFNRATPDVQREHQLVTCSAPRPPPGVYNHIYH